MLIFNQRISYICVSYCIITGLCIWCVDVNFSEKFTYNWRIFTLFCTYYYLLWCIISIGLQCWMSMCIRMLMWLLIGLVTFRFWWRGCIWILIIFIRVISLSYLSLFSYVLSLFKLFLFLSSFICLITKIAIKAKVIIIFEAYLINILAMVNKTLRK